MDAVRPSCWAWAAAALVSSGDGAMVRVAHAATIPERLVKAGSSVGRRASGRASEPLRSLPWWAAYKDQTGHLQTAFLTSPRSPQPSHAGRLADPSHPGATRGETDGYVTGRQGGGIGLGSRPWCDRWCSRAEAGVPRGQTPGPPGARGPARGR